MDGISVKSQKQGEIDWPRHYAALLEFYKQYGTCNVPQKAYFECDLVSTSDSSQDTEGRVYHYNGKLGRWLKNQRTARKGVQRAKLTVEREALLQKLVDEGQSVYQSVSHCISQCISHCISQSVTVSVSVSVSLTQSVYQSVSVSVSQSVSQSLYQSVYQSVSQSVY
jgi:hypothetical protein